LYIGTPRFTNDGIKTSNASTMYLVLEYMFIFKLGGKNISIQNSSNTVNHYIGRVRRATGVILPKYCQKLPVFKIMCDSR